MNILNKLKETAVSVLPIMGIVLVLGIFILHLEAVLLSRFVIGGLLLIVGLTIFLLGVDLGIQPLGERSGAALTKKSSLSLLLSVAFVIGFVVTAAEPDIQVFGDQVKGIFPFVNKSTMTFVIATGVGLYIMIGLLRTVLNLSIKLTFLIAYSLLFALAMFAPNAFIGIAFDSGGAVSGPMTSSFLLPLMIGICYQVGGNVLTDAFGLVALVALSPLLTIQILGIIYNIKSKKQIKVEDLDEAIIEYKWGN